MSVVFIQSLAHYVVYSIHITDRIEKKKIVEIVDRGSRRGCLMNRRLMINEVID